MQRGYSKNMRQKIEEKADFCLIKKCFRLDNNQLINLSDHFLLLEDLGEFKGCPLRELNESVYQNHYKSEVYKFKESLIQIGKSVQVLSSIEDLLDLVKNKKLITDKVLGPYEEEIDYRLSKVSELKSIRDLNYLLNDEDKVLEVFKAKMGFSAFRKKFEKLALSRNNHSELYSNTNLALQSYLNYLDIKAPLTYFETRNKMIGVHYSTKLSDKLNLGQLSPQTILYFLEDFEAKHGANKSTYWIKFELLWREYFYWLYQYHGEEFFQSNGLNGGEFEISKISHNDYLSQLNKHPLIKAMHNELVQTGFLSNRARQIYVSYLVHETELDWRYGAWFFQTYLKDYDLYSNWGNWLYGSGYGTDARGPRYFKISKQLAQYDKDFEYIPYWLGLEKKESQSISKSLSN